MRRGAIVAAALLVAAVHAAPAAAVDVVTVAGGGGVGDGEDRLIAGINFPTQLAFDGAGNLLIADSFNHRLRRVDAATGIVTTVAGTNESGWTGDGGPATAATLNGVHDVTVHPVTGDVYLADWLNGAVRRIEAGADGVVDGDADELISTVAGLGPSSFAYNGDSPAVMPTTAGLEPVGVTFDLAGNLYIADLNDRIRKVTPGADTVVDGSTDETITSIVAPPDVNTPFDVVADPDAPDSVYIVDSNHSRLAYFNGSGAPVTRNGVTVAAGTFAVLAATPFVPTAMALFGPGPSRTIYIADSPSPDAHILRLDPAGGAPVPVVNASGDVGFSGDGGPAIDALIDCNYGVATLGNDVYIGDSCNNRVRKVVGGADGEVGVGDPAEEIITTFAGSGFAGFPGMNALAYTSSLAVPQAVALDPAGNFYVADVGNERVFYVEPDGDLVHVAGTGTTGYGGDGGPAAAALLRFPNGVAFKPAGAEPGPATTGLYISDGFNEVVRYVNFGPGPVTFYSGLPDEVTIGAGDIATVAGAVDVFALVDGDAVGQARFKIPERLVVDAGGRVFVADRIGGAVRVLNPTAAPFTVAGVTIDPGKVGTIASGFTVTTGVRLDSAGNVFAVDSFGGHRVVRIDAGTGTVTTVAGTSGSPGFSGDGGKAIDAQLNYPGDIDFDSAGNLYITDGFNHRVRRVEAGSDGLVTGAVDETISTYAGDGSPGFTGDGGPALAASFNVPDGIAIDAGDRVYVADSFNNRIRLLSDTSVGPGDENQWIDVIPGVRVMVEGTIASSGSLTGTASVFGPMAPLGFELGPASRRVFFDLSKTFTVDPGTMFRIEINYDNQFAGVLSEADEANLRLLRYLDPTADPPVTEDVTVLPVDTAANRITGLVDDFSFFAVGFPESGVVPRAAKLYARQVLEAALPTGDASADRRIERAIRHLDHSLTPASWLDDATLHPARGQRVFRQEQRAISRLSGIDVPEVAGVVDALVAADRELAAAALAAASAAAGDPELLEEGAERLAEGDASAADGRPVAAVGHYAAAWRLAQKALA